MVLVYQNIVTGVLRDGSRFDYIVSGPVSGECEGDLHRLELVMHARVGVEAVEAAVIIGLVADALQAGIAHLVELRPHARPLLVTWPRLSARPPQHFPTVAIHHVHAPRPHVGLVQLPEQDEHQRDRHLFRHGLG
eukprot:scaffold2910_cov390-Prasinococcus_capsulatus_cf.AAC.6